MTGILALALILVISGWVIDRRDLKAEVRYRMRVATALQEKQAAYRAMIDLFEEKLADAEAALAALRAELLQKKPE